MMPFSSAYPLWCDHLYHKELNPTDVLENITIRHGFIKLHTIEYVALMGCKILYIELKSYTYIYKWLNVSSADWMARKHYK